MSEAVQIALIASLAPIAVLIVTHLLAARKIEEIHVLTNSTLTAANKRIEALEAQVVNLVAQKKGKAK